ncbi:hypothetical protein NLG97_g4592 [Lecanicillium saksenae]|uniref:Uncharacterized protein n=1 Tax=Lecanicillium saksenae TaxID=468837 RepID=A0ACC1QXH0_9HYPO|nr:hypothetical protein NLG97_g4592 [Lecanicillium saksenae]
MFSPFGTSTQSSTPATANPFAPKPTTNPFGQDGTSTSAFGAKPNPPNPFAQNTTSTTTLSGASNPFAPTPSAPVADAGNADKQISKPAWGTQANGAQPTFGQFGGKPSGFTKPDAKVNSTPAPAFPSGQMRAGQLPSSNDPHAKKVYEQLRKDGITPPAWPSQPGDPSHKTQMAKFREQYEDYRSKVRASLTRAGLIDDPTKRKTLQDAIDFKGICEDMCPEYEKITRITEHDIPTPEKDPQTLFASTTRMVKKLARSAAGQEAPLPMDVLSVPTLRKTLNYLVDDLLRDDENLPTLHGYLWDRTRAIRRDFSFFSALSTEEIKIQASVLEDIARFHVTALHLLSEGGKAPEDFVEQQELEQLGKALLTLRDIYDDCNAQGSPCENEAEFRAYYLLFHANDPNIVEIVQRQWRPSLWRNSDLIRTAVSLVEALQNTSDFHGPLQGGPSLAAASAHSAYFRIVEDAKVSYTMACFAECHFPQLRRSILQNVNKALSRPKAASPDVTAADLNKFLRFDTVQQAIDFAELHGIEFQPSQQNPADKNLSCAMLTRGYLPHHRLQHQFSKTFVESKRGSRPLPEVIHKTVFANAPKVASRKVSLAQEGSLFVQEEAPKSQSSMPPPPPKNPFGGFVQAPTNGNTASSTLTTVPSIPEKRKPIFYPPGMEPTPQPSAPSFGFPTASTAAPAVSLGISQQSSPFAKAIPPKTEAASGEPTAKESSPFKPAFSGTPAAPEQAAPALAPPSITTAPSFGFKPKVPEPSIAATSTTPQKVLPSFSGFPPTQPAKPVEAGKSSTPPGSPAAQVTPFAQSALPKPPAQPQAPTPANKAAVEVASFTPPSKPPVSFVNATQSPAAAPSFTAAPVQPAKPPQPKRDRLSDFTKWFVAGDDGLMTEFEQHFLDGLLAPIFLEWQRKEEEKRRLEQEARDNAEADRFRKRCLSLKYFYQWKTNAREKRLKFLRRSGREQLKNFYRSQQMASRIPQATPKTKSEVPLVPRPNREQALMEGLRQSQAKKRYIPAPTSSSTLEVGKARDSAAAIGRHFNLPMPQSGMSSPARSRSSSMSKGGSKTRALREELLGMGTGRFRRSLPSIASSEESSPESVRSSKVSERWRLKAMGIVQLPDGTAIPESLMNDRRFSSYSRSHRASSITSVPSRRPSISSIPPPPPFSSTEHVGPSAVYEDSASNKRKRVSEDSVGFMDQDDGAPLNGHKRVMSDAENLRKQLRAMREEMESETMWLKSQNERLHTEISSRGGTPMDDSF